MTQKRIYPINSIIPTVPIIPDTNYNFMMGIIWGLLITFCCCVLIIVIVTLLILEEEIGSGSS